MRITAKNTYRVITPTPSPDAVAQEMSQLSNSPSSVQHVRLIFFLVIIAYFMDIIDASIVTVALPSIRLEFGASIANSQWIYGAYAITLAGFLLLMG